MRLIALSILFAWLITANAAEHTPVFVPHSYSQEYPWTKRQHESFMQTLEGMPNRAFSTSVEYLDTKRIDYSPAYARQLAKHLAELLGFGMPLTPTPSWSDSAVSTHSMPRPSPRIMTRSAPAPF